MFIDIISVASDFVKNKDHALGESNAKESDILISASPMIMTMPRIERTICS